MGSFRQVLPCNLLRMSFGADHNPSAELNGVVFSSVTGRS